MSGELFAWAVMILAVGALIAFLDWISSNLDDAIDVDLSDPCAWGDHPSTHEELNVSHIGTYTPGE